MIMEPNRRKLVTMIGFGMVLKLKPGIRNVMTTCYRSEVLLYNTSAYLDVDTTSSSGT